jgi:ribosomal protein L17
MENGPFIDDFTINTSIYKGFSMAMLNNQMVTRFLLGDHPHRHRETEAVVKQCMVVALTRTVGKHYKARPGNLWELD